MTIHLSPRQGAILTAMGAGSVLRWRIYRGEWRWLLDGEPVDGRSVNGLACREILVLTIPASRTCGLVLTEAGRAYLAARQVAP